MQLEQRNFKTLIEQAHLEIVTSTHQLTTLNREKDIMAADSADRRSLSDKKNVLENNRKKHRKMQVKLSPLLWIFFPFSLKVPSYNMCFIRVNFRIDEFKDRIRVVLKGRFPPEKDVKKEVIKALR